MRPALCRVEHVSKRTRREESLGTGIPSSDQGTPFDPDGRYCHPVVPARNSSQMPRMVMQFAGRVSKRKGHERASWQTSVLNGDINPSEIVSVRKHHAPSCRLLPSERRTYDTRSASRTHLAIFQRDNSADPSTFFLKLMRSPRGK